MAPSITNLQQAVATAGDGVAIIAAGGTSNCSVMPLLNTALGVSLPVRTDPPPGGAIRSPPATLSASALPSGPLVFAVDGVDTTNLAEGTALDQSLSLSISLAGVIVFSARMHDMARGRTSGMSRLMSAVERALALRIRHVAPVLPARRLLVVAVHDFDDTEADENEARESIEALLAAAYDSIEVPDEYAGTSVSDVFDVHVALLRSQAHRLQDYERDVAVLADVLLDAGKAYADAGMTASGLPGLVDRIAGTVVSDASRDLPNERELRATFGCNTVMQAALDKFRNTAKVWKASVDANRIIRNFGVENDRLIERTLDVYDKDAIVYKTTRAFSRKRDELNSCLLSDSYALFSKQVLKVRENAYQVFRAKLARIRINDQVEKNVRAAVKEAESFFVQNSESLRSKLGNWRFDHERHELVNHMRDDATERLQLARLQGNYVPNMRAPIAFAFHTLLAAPFGQDSRFANPHAEDMKPSYDPDKIKQPGMMRSRPYQRGHNHKARSRDELDPEFLDMFADLYGESSEAFTN